MITKETTVTTRDNAGNPVVESGSVKLTRRKIEKGGLISYAREGVRSSIYFNKTMFEGESPVEIVLTAENMRAPRVSNIIELESLETEKAPRKSKKRTGKSRNRKAATSKTKTKTKRARKSKKSRRKA